jgi:hypothetical protein
VVGPARPPGHALVGRGSAQAPAHPHTRGRHLQAVEARTVRPAVGAARPHSRRRHLQAGEAPAGAAGEAPVDRGAEAAAHPQTHGRRSRTAEAPEPPGGRERCPRAGRAGVGRRAEGLEGLHAPGRDPRSGAQRARTAPGRQSRARHRRQDAIRAVHRVGQAEPRAVGAAVSPVAGWAPVRRRVPQRARWRSTTRQHPEAARQPTPPGRPAARQPRSPCPANPRRPPERKRSPPGPSALAHPRRHRPPRRRTRSPVARTRARVGDGRRREVRTGPRRGADRGLAEGQVASRSWEPGRWGWSPAMPAPRWKPPAPLPRRGARRPGATRPWVAPDPPRRSSLGPDRPRWPDPSRRSAPNPPRPVPPATLRPRPPGRARHQPREPGRGHRSGPGPARPPHPTQVPGSARAPPRPDRSAGSPPPDPRPAAPAQGVRRALGDLARDARAGGRGRSFGPRKLPRAAPRTGVGPSLSRLACFCDSPCPQPATGPIPPAAFER